MVDEVHTLAGHAPVGREDRPGSQRTPAELDVLVLADREDEHVRRSRDLGSVDPVVGARAEVDDDAVDVGQRGLEGGQ